MKTTITTGFPDYSEIENPKKRQQKQEIEHGRQTVMQTMAQGVIDRLVSEMNMKADIKLHCEDSDPRKWFVTIDFVNGVASRTESFFDFPSNELKTIQMLLTK